MGGLRRIMALYSFLKLVYLILTNVGVLGANVETVHHAIWRQGQGRGKGAAACEHAYIQHLRERRRVGVVLHR